MRRLSAQARRRGVRLTGADTPANLRTMDHGLVDEVVAFDVHRVEASQSWASGWAADIDAVLTFREMCVEPVAAVAEKLGVAGNERGAVRTIRTKDLCRGALRTAGFTQPTCTVVSDAAAARRFLDGTGPGPWIVKPRDGMGSVHVTLVRRPDELTAAVAPFAGGAPFIVETFVDGPEFSAEGVLLGGVPTVLALTAKSVGDGFVETGHRMPAPLDGATAARAGAQVEHALRAVGITHGVFHVEFWLRDGEVVLGEIHARPGGDFLHAMVEDVRPGLELYGTLVDDLLGAPAAPLPASSGAAAAHFLVLPAGTVQAVHGWAELSADPSVLACDLAVHPGDEVRQVRSSADRHGVYVVGGADAADVDAALLRLASQLRIDVH
jgi:biotin carboxylase